MKDNKDITSYRGYASLGIIYRPLKKTFVEVDLQPAYKDKLTGFAKIRLGVRISSQYNQYLYVQYFGGYSEDLINYNQSTNNLHVGIIFKDLWSNFKKVI